MAVSDDDRRLSSVPLRPVQQREVVKLLRTRREDMFRAERRAMKQRKKSGPVAKVAEAHESFDADVSEAFRRARSQVGQITADLNQLRRRATSAVKGTTRPAKSR